MLSKVPGFIRARRFKLESYGEGGAPKPNTYLALYDIESVAFVQEPSFVEAISTPWMAEVGKKWVENKLVGVWGLQASY